MKRIFFMLAIGLISCIASADISTAPWIAMQQDDSIVVPMVHAPSVKQVLGDRHPGQYTLPMFRRVFDLPRHQLITSAVLQVCGLGQFECRLDGKKVGDHFLDPGWSDYAKEAEYVSFDVTNAIRACKHHILGVMLGNGFYNIPRERYFKMVGSYGAPKLRVALVITYKDGSREQIQTDKLWRVTASPITYSSIYGGEDYDARLENKGWDCNKQFDESRWAHPILLPAAKTPKLVEQEGTEMTYIDTLAPRNPKHQVVKIKDQKPYDAWIYDFGQNLSGIVELTLKHSIPAGRIITVRPAELLDADGNINQGAAGPYMFRYIGNGRETIGTTWTPRFSYYGFRYVEISGVRPDSVSVVMIHTSNAVCRNPKGKFHCSNDTLNRIHDLIDRAIRSNLASIPTDCPTREKLGWLEQSYLMLPSLLCRYDMKPLYTRLMRQMANAQQSNGMIPTVAPYYAEMGDGFDDSPEWGAAFILAPWILYQHDHDETLLRQYYPQMQRYAQYLYERAREERDAKGRITKPRHILAYGLGDWYDLGPKGPGYSQLTPVGLTATATYYCEILAMSKIAAVVQHSSEAQQYASLADSIRQAYCARYDTCQSQTALSMGLYLRLLPSSKRNWAQQKLLADLSKLHTTSDAKGTQQWKTYITTGDIGFAYLIRALASLGKHDVILRLATRPETPGYGYQLAHGITTLTESWQALPTVSQNHMMLGHLMEWLYGYVGGIRLVDGQYSVRPADVPGISNCQCSYPTDKGSLSVRWHRRPDNSIAFDLK